MIVMIEVYHDRSTSSHHHYHHHDDQQPFEEHSILSFYFWCLSIRLQLCSTSLCCLGFFFSTQQENFFVFVMTSHRRNFLKDQHEKLKVPKKRERWGNHGDDGTFSSSNSSSESLHKEFATDKQRGMIMTMRKSQGISVRKKEREEERFISEVL